jgi:hypothetical protein
MCFVNRDIANFRDDISLLQAASLAGLPLATPVT